jgi:hypothetical protein
MAMNDNDMPFTRENYLLMLVGLGIVGIGYLLMSGGGSGDPNVFNEDIFSARRITVAPIVLLLGYVFIIYAILKRPRSNSEA